LQIVFDVNLQSLHMYKILQTVGSTMQWLVFVLETFGIGSVFYV